MKKNTESFKWFYQDEIVATTSYSYKSVHYDTTSANNIKTVTYATTAINSLKAVADDYTCAILSDAAGTTVSGVAVVKFLTNDNLIEDIVTSDIVDDATTGASNTYQVGKQCNSLSIGIVTYSYYSDLTPKFLADTPPATAWVSPVFNSDFSYAAGNSGLYKKTFAASPDPSTWASVKSTSFLANKKVWSNTDVVVVFSWADSAGATPTTVDYQIQVFKIAATYT